LLGSPKAWRPVRKSSSHCQPNLNWTLNKIHFNFDDNKNPAATSFDVGSGILLVR
jgi:hypothetical protein